MLVNKTIGEFIAELASDSPAPGGGSVAALVGALGAALCTMVMNLTAGEKYEGISGEVAQIKRAAEELQAKLAGYIDEDTDAFRQVMAAYRLPKATDADKEKRAAAVQAAMKKAAELPLAVADACLELLQLTIRAGKAGNKNAASDAAVAGVITHAALHSALYNVRINLPAIKDEVYVRQTRTKAAALASRSEELNREVRHFADEEIN